MLGPLRIIPPGYRVYDLRLEGVTPLLMNSSEFDRRSETYRAFKQIGAKRGKTIEDELRLAELEFHLGIYYDEKLGPFVPGANVHELLRSAATKFRRGADVSRSLIVPEYRIPLIYDGPKDAAKLYDEGFYDVRMVANAGAGSGRVPRCRPKFEEWAVECEIAFDPDDLDDDMVASVVQRSIKYGFCDGRKIGFGAFMPTLTFNRVQRENAKADPVKRRNNADKKNVKEATKRIMAKS